MPLVNYDVLYPTGDAVGYDPDASLMYYPDSNIYETFGPVFTPKIYAKDMNILELASSGKIALTLSNEHVLDFIHDPAEETVHVNARSNELILCTDLGNATSVFTLGASNASLETDDNSMVFDPSGATLLSDGDVYVTACNPSSHVGVRSELTATVDAGRTLDLKSQSNITVRTETAAGSNTIAMNDSGICLNTDWDICFNVPVGNKHQFMIGGETVACMYKEDDVLGGKLVFEAQAVTSLDGFVKLPAYRPDSYNADIGPCAQVIDRDSSFDNDAAGLLIDHIHADVENSNFFAKYLQWRHNEDGPLVLGTKHGASNESFWDFAGGAVRFTYINPNNGSKLGYHWRVNERDELELVKVTDYYDGSPTQYKVVSYFGRESRSCGGGGDAVNITRDSGFMCYHDESSTNSNVSVPLDSFTVDTRADGGGADLGPSLEPGFQANMFAPMALDNSGDAYKTIDKYGRLRATIQTFMADGEYNLYTAVVRKENLRRPTTKEVLDFAAVRNVGQFKTVDPLLPFKNRFSEVDITSECDLVDDSNTGTPLKENVIYTVCSVVRESDVLNVDPVTGEVFKSVKPLIYEYVSAESTPPQIDYFEFDREVDNVVLRTMPSSVQEVTTTVKLDFCVSDNFRVSKLYFYQQNTPLTGPGPDDDDDFFWDASRVVFADGDKSVKRAYKDAGGTLHYVIHWTEARELFQDHFASTEADTSSPRPAVNSSAYLLDLYKSGATAMFLAKPASAYGEGGAFPDPSWTAYESEAAMRADVGISYGDLKSLRGQLKLKIAGNNYFDWMPSGAAVKELASASNSYAVDGVAQDFGAGAEAALTKTPASAGGATYPASVWTVDSDENGYRVTELKYYAPERFLASPVGSAPDFVRDPASSKKYHYTEAPHYPQFPSGYGLSAEKSGHGNAEGSAPGWDPLGCTFSNTVTLSNVRSIDNAYNYLAVEDAWGNITTLAGEVSVLRPVAVINNASMAIELGQTNIAFQHTGDGDSFAFVSSLDSSDPDVDTSNTEHLLKVISDVSAARIVEIEMMVVPADVQMVQAHGATAVLFGQFDSASFHADGQFPVADHSDDYGWASAARTAMVLGEVPDVAPDYVTGAPLQVISRKTEAEIQAIFDEVDGFANWPGGDNTGGNLVPLDPAPAPAPDPTPAPTAVPAPRDVLVTLEDVGGTGNLKYVFSPEFNTAYVGSNYSFDLSHGSHAGSEFYISSSSEHDYARAIATTGDTPGTNGASLEWTPDAATMSNLADGRFYIHDRYGFGYGTEYNGGLYLASE